jgi:DNA invertase Pin-like site-specific DNA recombinase
LELTFDTVSGKVGFMNIGYCRISTDSQNDSLQLQALKDAGCEKIFSDVASGSKTDRVGLRECIEFARSGDVIVAWKLDRIGRSLKDLIETVNTLKEREIGLKIITQQLDTTSSSGMLFFYIMGALAEFEKSLIQERTRAGILASRARGRLGGRPKALDKKQVAVAESLYADGKTSISQICKTLGISRATFYRNIALKAA